MAANDHSIVIGILAVIATGALIGLFNYLLIRSLRIPPIIATLSSSFVLQSFAISLGRGGGEQASTAQRDSSHNESRENQRWCEMPERLPVS
jgi:ribose/xylose/arabinose/galactoside ABC-type transport system permease subunit